MKTNLYFFFALMLICNTLFSQTSEEFKLKAEKAYELGDLPKAIELGEKALNLAIPKSYNYADIENDLGIYYSLNNEIDKGILLLKESLSLIEDIKGKESKEYIEKLNNLVSIYYTQSNYEQASSIAKESVFLSNKVYGSQHQEYGYSLNLKGLTLVALGQYIEAEEAYLKSLNVFEQNKKSEEYASVLTNLGDLCISTGKYEQAKEYLKKSLKSFEKMQKTTSKSYSDCLFTLGKVCKITTDFEDALFYYAAAGEILKNLLGETHQEYATTLSAKASVYEAQQRYIEAEELYIKANNIKRKAVGEDGLTYLISANNLGSMYLSLGRNKDAQQILEPIVINSASRAAEFPLDYASFASNLALAYHRLGKYVEADEIYKNVLLLQEAILGREHIDNVVLLNNRASLKIEQNNFDEADQLFNRCLSILQENKLTNSQEYVDILYMKGLNLMNKEEYFNAKEYLIKAVQLAKTVYGKHHKMYAAIYINTGFLFHKLKENKQAEKYYIEGMNCYRDMINNRISFMSLEEKKLIKKDIHLHFSFFKQFVLDYPTPQLRGAMYDYHLMIKSMITNSKIRIRKEVIAGNNKTLQQLFDRWTNDREKLNRLYSFSTQTLLAEKVNIDSIAAAVKLLENKLALQTSSFSKDQNYKELSWKNIQENLGVDEAAIEIIRTAYYGEEDPIPIKYLAMILTKETTDAPLLIVLEDGRKIENEWSDDFYFELFNKREDSLSYNRLWLEIASAVNTKNKLYVSRTGVYNVLNITTFKNPKTGKYVLEEKDLVLVGNTRDIIEIKKPQNLTVLPESDKYAALFGFPNYYLDITKEEAKKDELLAMANLNERTFKKDFELVSELLGTKKEVENIDSILNQAKWNTKIYLENDATESKIKELKHPTVLHIATHGFFDWQYEEQSETDVSRMDRSVSQRDPLYRSGLMLAGSGFVVKLLEGKMSLINNLEDGILSAYEVVNMDLSKTDLVILSACLSGIGETKVKETESFSGLLQAFILAGAKSVVTSGWSVDDRATQELMTLFYSNLVKKESKRMALRQAQLTLKEKFPEPFYWGAFTMIGQ